MDAAVGDLVGQLDRLAYLQGRAAALLAGVGALRRRAEAAQAERDALRARLGALEGARPGRST